MAASGDASADVPRAGSLTAKSRSRWSPTALLRQTSTGPGRRLRPRRSRKRSTAAVSALHLHHHARRVVQDEAREPQVGAQAVDVGPEPDALHGTPLHADAARAGRMAPRGRGAASPTGRGRRAGGQRRAQRARPDAPLAWESPRHRGMSRLEPKPQQQPVDGARPAGADLTSGSSGEDSASGRAVAPVHELGRRPGRLRLHHAVQPRRPSAVRIAPAAASPPRARRLVVNVSHARLMAIAPKPPAQPRALAHGASRSQLARSECQARRLGPPGSAGCAGSA